MRLAILLIALVSTGAAGMDLCPQYASIHAKEVAPRIKSGIPFKLLSVATDGEHTSRKIVRIEFDLWNEKVEVETFGDKKQKVDLRGAEALICQQLSIGDIRGQGARFQILLNPDLSVGLSKLRIRGVGKSGLLGVNWKSLAQELNSEKILLEGNVQP
jgi:hypothetical protein